MPLTIDLASGLLAGENLQTISRPMGEMKGVFHDQETWRAIDPATLVYRVQMSWPVPEGQPGMACRTSLLEPGMVGDEYFMTKGHFHRNPDGPEYYVTCAGEGGLILMDRNRRTWWEPMRRGSVNYVPAGVAHRVANTGCEVLAFFSCWPSDIGHDYETIRSGGFSARLRSVNGRPELVPDPEAIT